MANFKSGLGNNVKLLRKTKNITQEELAEIIGIHPRQLSKIETGEHFPSCKTLEKLCMVLDVEPKALFDFEFLIDVNESALTGTDNTIAYKVETTENKNNIYQLRPDSSTNINDSKPSIDKSMAQTAKAMNKPVFVEYMEEGKTTKLVVFYPDGKEKVIRNSIDTTAKQNMIYMMTEFKKITKDPQAVEFIKCALNSLKDDKDLKKLDSIIYGMKLARGID